MSESWEERTRTWLKGLFGDSNEKRVKALQVYVDKANSFEPAMQKLSDEELQGKTAEFRRRIDEALKNVPDVKLIPDDAPKMPGQFRTQKDKVLDEVLEQMLPEAFAVVREAGRRVLNMRHFDVQLMGGAALHFNKISEMRTGEGKTLVATLPVYLNALTGRGVHVVTVNDYLARRDAEWMGQIYKFLGLTVGLIYSHQPDDEKYAAYRCDISYGTNHEFGFDYLRDNMRKSLDQLVQRPYYFAVVDEVDNILIDEARTPLIISGFPTESFQEVYLSCAKVAPMLERGQDKEDEDCDYWVDEKGHSILLTERGQDRAEQFLGVTDLFDMHFNYHHHVVQALKAKELYKLDVNYVIRPNEEGKMEAVIVDEFTGRMMQGRRWSDGLHQAVEAKEGIPIQEETLTYASITYQNLFRLYPKLSGMTGTAMTEAAEFNKIYNLDVVAIPTNKTAVRGDQADVIYKTELQKYISVIEEIVECHEEGRPVLVGTVSIEKSELVAELLSKPQQMGEVLLKKIQKVMDSIKKNNLSGDNIDALKKLFERPALIDTSKMEETCKLLEKEFPKKEDFLERIYSALRTARVVSAVRKGIPHHVLNAKHHEKEAMIVAQAGRKGAVTIATNMAGRGTDILLGGNPEFQAKEKVLKDNPNLSEEEFDARVKELKEKLKVETDREHDEVVKMGGLHIIGTERHEARRIDNQLRGRAGRQGDPGSTRFFLSLEDQLMRIFGGDKIARLMELIRADEEMPIESGMVSKSIENAQKKVEAHHFDMRKHVLQYDDVLNTQREVIYRERRRLLERADLRQQVIDMLNEHLDMLLGSYIDSDAPPEFWEEDGLPEVVALLKNDIPLLEELKDTELHGLSYDDLRAELWKQIKMAYEVREQHIGADHMREMERQILLNTIDGKWVDYLHNIDLLREGIHLRGYGQRDPLQEYKREAFDMFNRLLKSIKEESIQLIFRAQPVIMDMDDLEGLILNELKSLGQDGDALPDLDQQQFADLVSGIISGKSPEELGLIGKTDDEEDLDSDAEDNLKGVMEHLGEVDSLSGEVKFGEDAPSSDAQNGTKGDDSDKKAEVKSESGSRKSKKS
ncbi:MAG: preprotein translocase subunit SecA [Candidatus Obscuribacterales bacterium]|nr:preprotein translocase subunit SecA [Candidatus Obscuribacterales bacterium]